MPFVLVAVASQWLCAVRMAVNVAAIKNEQALLIETHRIKSTDTLYLNAGFEKQIVTTREIRLGGNAYDVVSWQKTENGIRAIVVKDADETKLEHVAVKDSERSDDVQTTPVAFPLYFEETTAAVPTDTWFGIDACGYRPLPLYDGLYAQRHAPPPKAAA